MIMQIVMVTDKNGEIIQTIDAIKQLDNSDIGVLIDAILSPYDAYVAHVVDPVYGLIPTYERNSKKLWSMLGH